MTATSDIDLERPGFVDRSGGRLAAASADNPVALELGCGHRRDLPHGIGIDVLDYPGVDVIGDVYDVLAALTTAGLVRRIQPSGSVARYESRVDDNHHHVVCRSCGVIADVDCAVGDAPCLTPSDGSGLLEGFSVDEAEVIYWGLCPDCSTARTV